MTMAVREFEFQGKTCLRCTRHFQLAFKKTSHNLPMQPINDVVFASFPKSHYNNVENEYSAKLTINNILGIV